MGCKRCVFEHVCVILPIDEKLEKRYCHHSAATISLFFFIGSLYDLYVVSPYFLGQMPKNK